MEIVEVPTAVGAGSLVLDVAHSMLGLSRGLEPGEQLVLHDRAGEFHAATVADITFTLDDTHYVLTVGARLTAEMAEQRRLGLQTGSEDADLHDVVDLLGDLRRIRAERAAKAYTATEKTKLSGIATGATANDTDANLKNRANHTGSQAISTITSLQTTLDAKAAISGSATGLWMGTTLPGSGTAGVLYVVTP